PSFPIRQHPNFHFRRAHRNSVDFLRLLSSGIATPTFHNLFSAVRRASTTFFPSFDDLQQQRPTAYQPPLVSICFSLFSSGSSRISGGSHLKGGEVWSLKVDAFGKSSKLTLQRKYTQVPANNKLSVRAEYMYICLVM
ncbi:hypothetical protein LINPERHAP1_LOCUS17683, partial [Linum perenne]